MPALVTRLSPADIAAAATAYGLDPATLRAVIAVESGGSGFLPDGRPKILLEGHLLWKRLLARGIDPHTLAVAYPDTCYPKWTKRYYRGGVGEWGRLEKVCIYGRHVGKAESYQKAAWEACSWGLFQILGLHYERLGFPDVVRFREAMESGEPAHLDACMKFLETGGLIPVLRARNWLRFAYSWNGPGATAVYSAKLALAYAREKKRG